MFGRIARGDTNRTQTDTGGLAQGRYGDERRLLKELCNLTP
jgi:hypothetical protein